MVIEMVMAASVGYVGLKMDWVLEMDPEETKYLATKKFVLNLSHRVLTVSYQKCQFDE